MPEHLENRSIPRGVVLHSLRRRQYQGHAQPHGILSRRVAPTVVQLVPPTTRLYSPLLLLPDLRPRGRCEPPHAPLKHTDRAFVGLVEVVEEARERRGRWHDGANRPTPAVGAGGGGAPLRMDEEHGVPTGALQGPATQRLRLRVDAGRVQLEEKPEPHEGRVNPRPAARIEPNTMIAAEESQRSTTRPKAPDQLFRWP